jgi:hypothetical protein
LLGSRDVFFNALYGEFVDQDPDVIAVGVDREYEEILLDGREAIRKTHEPLSIVKCEFDSLRAPESHVVGIGSEALIVLVIAIEIPDKEERLELLQFHFDHLLVGLDMAFRTVGRHVEAGPLHQTTVQKVGDNVILHEQHLEEIVSGITASVGIGRDPRRKGRRKLRAIPARALVGMDV